MESFAIFEAFHDCRIENGSVSIAGAASQKRGQ